MRRIIIIVLLLLLLLSGGTVWWLLQQFEQKHSVDALLTIVPGHGSGVIAKLLEKQKVVSSARLFRLLVRMQDAAPKLKAGEYRFVGHLSMRDVLLQLQKGEVVLHQVTVPEGLRSDEVLHLLARKTKTEAQLWFAALDMLLGNMEHEGRLLPETYSYIKPLQPKRLLQQMLNAQQQVLASLPDDVDRQKVRILASIIEKETRLDKERPLVAAVLHNRLQKGMRLQMDPTVIYGIWRTTGAFSGNIHKRDLRTPTPWNTYVIDGLPPTPISNPGKASLLAAMNPADVDYLYFVADGTGGHAFASTLAEHQRNVRRWVQMEREKK